MSEKESIFKSISSMEPIFPSGKRAELAALSTRIFTKAGELKSALPSGDVRAEVAKLVREMNSYYSNLIEGHKTLPRDIERALRQDFSDQDEILRNQRMSVAHIKAEDAMRTLLANEPETDVFSPDFLAGLHREFYRNLPGEEWHTTSKSGVLFSLKPGEWRDHNVGVGRHIPPDYDALEKFLARFHSCYSNQEILATDQLIVLSAAHHRLAWIHPFGDGNGRVARLHSQAALFRAGVDADGLWTLSRGLARTKNRYYQMLQSADQKRRNDYDGRGNLSDRGLTDFCSFFLQQILDQMEFMIGLIQPFDFQKRIDHYLRYERVDLGRKKREHFSTLLRSLFLLGETARGAIPKILGLKETAAREVIRDALKDGLIAARSEKGAIRIAFPHQVLEAYFPRLFRDLPVEE